MREQQVGIFVRHEGWIPPITMYGIPRIGETVIISFKDKDADCTVRNVVWKQTDNNVLICDHISVEFNCFR